MRLEQFLFIVQNVTVLRTNNFVDKLNSGLTSSYMTSTRLTMFGWPWQWFRSCTSLLQLIRRLTIFTANIWLVCIFLHLLHTEKAPSPRAGPFVSTSYFWKKDELCKTDKGKYLEGQSHIRRIYQILRNFNPFISYVKLFWNCNPLPSYVKDFSNQFQH